MQTKKIDRTIDGSTDI